MRARCLESALGRGSPPAATKRLGVTRGAVLRPAAWLRSVFATTSGTGANTARISWAAPGPSSRAPRCSRATTSIPGALVARADVRERDEGVVHRQRAGRRDGIRLLRGAPLYGGAGAMDE